VWSTGHSYCPVVLWEGFYIMVLIASKVSVAMDAMQEGKLHSMCFPT
jgi:hypothetical protein